MKGQQGNRRERYGKMYLSHNLLYFYVLSKIRPLSTFSYLLFFLMYVFCLVLFVTCDIYS